MLRLTIKGVINFEPSLNIGKVNFKKPYPPNFNKIPAKRTLPATGASVCA
jgi:hypothetical protein